LYSAVSPDFISSFLNKIETKIESVETRQRMQQIMLRYLQPSQFKDECQKMASVSNREVMILENAIAHDYTDIIEAFIDSVIKPYPFGVIYHNQTLLNFMIRSGNKAIVHLLLNNGVNPNYSYKESITALMIAAEKGDLEVTRSLIFANANVNSQDSDFRTALMIAVENDNLPVVEELIECGANIDMYDKNRKTALMIAVEKENLSIVKTLISARANVNPFHGNIETPLLIAVRSRNPLIVHELIKAGANPNIRDFDFCTPLMIAVKNRDIDLIPFFRESGSLNTSITNYEGYNALMIACGEGFEEVVKALLTFPFDVSQKGFYDKFTALHLAILSQSREGISKSAITNIVSMLLDYENNGEKIDLEARDADECTPLLLACELRNADVVRILMAAGAKIEIQNEEGKTPLMIAAEKGDVITCIDLINVDARIECESAFGYTPLIIAAKNGHHDVVSLLLLHGAQLDRIMGFGQTALSLAVEGSHVKAVSNLIQAAIVQNKTHIFYCIDNEGKTPFTLAIEISNYQIVNAFIEIGINVNTVTPFGKTPLMVAAEQKDEKIVELLLSKGALMEPQSQEGLSCLHLAAQHGHADIAKMFLKALQEQGKMEVAYQEDIKGDTALAKAIYNEDLEMIKVFIDSGFDINIPNRASRTLLMLAVELNKIKIVRFLISHGADIYRTSSLNLRALDIAFILQYKEISSVLLVKEIARFNFDIEIHSSLVRPKDRNKTLLLAKDVIHYVVLFSSKNKNLFEKAIEAVLTLEVQKQDPYFIHALIVKNKNSFTPTQEQMPLMRIEPCKASIALNLEKLQRACKEFSQKNYKTLMEEIHAFNQRSPEGTPKLGPEVFDELFSQSMKNLQRDSSLSGLIPDLQNIAHKFLNPMGVIYLSLHRPIIESDIVPAFTEKLYQIAELLLEKSTNPEPGQSLSPRILAILTYCPMIENCPAGLEEGAVLCYNALKRERGNTQSVESLSMSSASALEEQEHNNQKVEKYIQSTVQATIDQIIRSLSILRDLQIPNVENLDTTHQATCLYNILGEDCGVNYKEHIDFNGGFTSRELILTPRKEILEVFFKELTLNIVSKFQESFTLLDQKSKNERYNMLNQFLEGSDVNLYDVWSFDEEVSLTEFGAIEVLRKAGYFHSLSLSEYEKYSKLTREIETLGENSNEEAIHSLKAQQEKALSDLRSIAPSTINLGVIKEQSDTDKVFGSLPGDLQDLKNEIELIEEMLSYIESDSEFYKEKSKELSNLEDLYQEAYRNLFQHIL